MEELEYLKESLKDYVTDRDAAIIESIKTDSVKPFKEFIDKYKALGNYPRSFKIPSDEVLEISIRKMSLHCVKIPPEIKGLAVDWLLERNYDLNLD